MTDITYTPFKEAFKDTIIAKNLLAENTCEKCIHCKKYQSDYLYIRHTPKIKKKYKCTLKDTETTLDSTCEDFELNELMWVISDIQANKNTKFL